MATKQSFHVEETSQSVSCTTSKELSDALKSEVDRIVIEGDLANRVFRIKATGKVAWGVCAASLTIGIGLIVASAVAAPVLPVAGAEAFLAMPAAVPAVTILGSAAATAIAIGVCAGGVGVLTTLRDKYEIVKKGKKHLELKKKSPQSS